MRRRRGFTLIEIMIVVAITGILAAIAVPKFADLVRKSKEGATRGNLGSLRSALSIYYGNNEGFFPSGSWATNSNVLNSTLVPTYLSAMPAHNVNKYHASSTLTYCHPQWSSGHNHDFEGWAYDGYYPSSGTDSDWGKLWIFCSHTDTKGTSWSDY